MVGADLGKAGIFRQKAIAWVNRRDMAGEGSSNNVGNIEIAAATGGFANAHRLIGQLHMQGMAIYGGIDGNRCNAQFLTGTQNPQCNFATIGNQNFRKGHGGQR